MNLKHPWFIYIAMLIVSCCFSTISLPAQPAQTKHALIFAIANYPSVNGWPHIASLNDAVALRQALLRQGFDSSHIITVSDSSATVEGISSALDQLVSRINPGDFVMIHFSCHGERVKSDDENRIDQLDDCIVTFNAVSPDLSKNFLEDQRDYFRGQRLGDHLIRVRKKLAQAGDLLVLLDYCHSGRGTRGFATVRGGKRPLVPHGFATGKSKKSDSSGIMPRTTQSVAAGLSPFAVISATRPEELDTETEDDDHQPIGPLTYALTKSFENLEPGTTYRSLFASIQSIMNVKVPSQHPLLEGNESDRLLMGGLFREQKRYFEIARIIDKSQLLLNGGLLSGLDTGMRISLFPAGTINPDPAQLLTAGKIIKVTNFNALIQLDHDPKLLQALSAWAFVSEQRYRIDPVIVGIQLLKSKNAKALAVPQTGDLIKNALVGLPFISFEGRPELMIVSGIKQDSIKIAANGYLFSVVPHDTGYAKKLNEQLVRYAQYKFLQEVNIQHDQISMDIRLVPVINGKADTANIGSRMVNGRYEFHNGDKLFLWIRNKASRVAYVNMLDMQPDGLINPLLPDRSKNIYPYDLKFNPGQTRLLTQYEITISPPYGTEVFKAFVSTREINMEDVARNRGQNESGGLSFFERLLSNSYHLSTRGSETIAKGIVEGATYNILFQIKP